MKQIAATHGCFSLVDDEDFAHLSQYRWQAKLHNANRGVKSHFRPIRTVAGKCLYLYHDILPKRDGFVIDHINGNVWDNRRCNLRYATRAQNISNQDGHRGRARPYKGIFKRRERWFVTIGVGGQNVSGGGYATAEDAARAYDELALKHHGQFARLNFPQGIAA